MFPSLRGCRATLFLFWAHHNKNRATPIPITPALQPLRTAQKSAYSPPPLLRGHNILVFTSLRPRNSEPEPPVSAPVLSCLALSAGSTTGDLAAAAVSTARATARVRAYEFSDNQRGSYQAPWCYVCVPLLSPLPPVSVPLWRPFSVPLSHGEDIQAGARWLRPSLGPLGDMPQGLT